MRNLLILLAVFLMACNRDKTIKKAMPAPTGTERVATFAGGCFWAMQECMVELKGVNKVVSGYSGGETANPAYEEVSSGKTGHAEAVQVYYDPALISFQQLTTAFLHAHDPTELNRQGPDVGTDYRSIAFYRNAEEKAIIAQAIMKLNGSKYYPEPVVTEVTPFKVIYPAENYHQNYYNIHPDENYIETVSKPKVMKLRAAVPDLLKPEYR